MTETITLALVLIPSLIVAIVFHEVAHGWAALALGDPTARDLNRLSFNPVRHVDPIGTLLVPGALALFGGPIFGWAKPVPVIRQRLKNPRFGMMAVAIAGPLMNFLLAGIGAILLGIAAGWSADAALRDDNLLVTGLFYFILINVFLGLFNLLPIPPFDGSHIVGGLLPAALRKGWYKLQRIGMIMILGIIIASWVFGTEWIAEIVMPPVEWAMGHYIALADLIAN